MAQQKIHLLLRAWRPSQTNDVQESPVHLPWLGQARQAAPQERAATRSRGICRGRTSSIRRVGKRSHPEGPERCFSSGVPRRELSSLSSSHQPATLGMASRLVGAQAPCTQPPICKASNKISPWRHRQGHSSICFQGAAQPFRNEEGKEPAPHNQLPIACARAIPEQAIHR